MLSPLFPGRVLHRPTSGSLADRMLRNPCFLSLWAPTSAARLLTIDTSTLPSIITWAKVSFDYSRIAWSGIHAFQFFQKGNDSRFRFAFGSPLIYPRIARSGIDNVYSFFSFQDKMGQGVFGYNTSVSKLEGKLFPKGGKRLLVLKTPKISNNFSGRG
jgi:hypothetical protein